MNPVDGISLKPLFEKGLGERATLVPFRYGNKGALADNDYKLVATSISDQKFELYHLGLDQAESTNVAETRPEYAGQLRDKKRRE